MKATVIQGNVFDVLPTLAPGSVDCVVTSPPYWKLRSYLPQDHPLKPLELGSEPTPAEFVVNLVSVFRLVRTVMADHAMCWLNIGDTYATGGGGIEPKSPRTEKGVKPINAKRIDLDHGNLCLIPQRLAIALQDDGWIVRSVIVWHKPAPMPASLSGWAWRRHRVKVKAGWTKETHPSRSGVSGDISQSGGVATGKRDGVAQWADCPGCTRCSPNGGLVLREGSWRPTSSWEPILMLAKSADYYADGEAVKTPASSATVSRDQYSRVLDDPDEQFAVRHDHETICDGGANLRDVWTIAGEGLKEKHYASFPTRLVHNCLKSGTSAKGYCVECGAPWVRVIERVGGPPQGDHNLKRDNSEWSAATPTGARMMYGGNLSSIYAEYGMPENRTIGWRHSCTCSADVRPGLVLDPFVGSGRVGIEANRLGLDFVGCELNPAYVEMSRRILYDACPLFSQSDAADREAEKGEGT